MIALTEVLGKHLPAVERDLIVAGLHLHDIGTPRLSWAELESFVFAAPPTSSTHTSRTEGWNKDAQMLAATQAITYSPTGKPPVGGVRAGMQPGGGRQPVFGALENARGRNLRPAQAQETPPDNPNRKSTNLLAGATAMPLNQFRERQEARMAQWRAEQAAKREQEGA